MQRINLHSMIEFRRLESHAELSLGVIGRLAGMIRKLTDTAQGLALQSAYRRLVARLYERVVKEDGTDGRPRKTDAPVVGRYDWLLP